MDPVVRPDIHYVLVHYFRKYPWDEVRDPLSTAPWYVMDIYDDVVIIISILHHCLDMYAPVHTVHVNHSHAPA